MPKFKGKTKDIFLREDMKVKKSGYLKFLKISCTNPARNTFDVYRSKHFMESIYSAE